VKLFILFFQRSKHGSAALQELLCPIQGSQSNHSGFGFDFGDANDMNLFIFFLQKSLFGHVKIYLQRRLAVLI
jgi:hypothetical protein